MTTMSIKTKRLLWMIFVAACHPYESTQSSVTISSVEAFALSTRLQPRHSLTSPLLQRQSPLQSVQIHHDDNLIDPPQKTQEHQRSNALETILRSNDSDYHFSQRLITIPIQPSTVILAEVYISKQCELAQILSVVVSPEPQPPKFRIQIISTTHDNNNDNNNVNSTAHPVTTEMVVDIGQITTIWDDCHPSVRPDKMWNTMNNNYVQQYLQANVDHAEFVLDRLHQTRRSRSNQSGSQSKLVIPNFMSGEHTKNEQEYATMVLQKIHKTGKNYKRIIDSSLLVQYLQLGTTKKASDDSFATPFRNRWIAASLLAKDAQLGGRWKRWPCIYVSTTTTNHKDDNDDTDAFTCNVNNTTTATVVSIVNGGWLATDAAVRTGTEARKFVERTIGTVDTVTTLADERIFRRLECLAMGELIRSTMNPDSDRRIQKTEEATSPELELDVREVLRTMNLPINPDGAKQALIQTGYWSKDISKQINLAKMIQPWSKPILDAAKWYTETYLRRMTNIRTGHDDTSGRVDLTQLPCVCIDAMKATFRDDAIGVRLRSSTGRTVQPDVSKWEILVHITDVSDIYAIFPTYNSGIKDRDDDHQFRTLRDAAARCGSSRYDLPFGPLHLLPPVVLQALSFPTKTTEDSNQAARCRCVTMWAYIDERNGQLVDCGIERTLIAPPITLTFGEATDLLDRKGTTVSNNEMQRKTMQAAQAILMVAERNLKLWDDYERQHNLVAQQREVRLATRERSSMLQKVSTTTRQWELRDDGVDGFRRTRGHRLVDVALNLYTNVAMQLLQQIRAPIPRAMGADYNTRGGRVGTAPLRRYIDGQIQRQLLAMLCQHGTPMTLDECRQVSIVANQANNSINNVRAIRKNTKK